MTKTLKKITLAMIGLIVFFRVGFDVKADILSPDSLQDAKWDYKNEVSYIGKGWIQATCVTDQYIVCFQNGSSKKSTKDTLIAFYKGDTDGDGDSVEKYTYAMHMTEMDYEHGNGMTYNSNTNEIYIAAGPLLNPENSGNIYVVDADTLTYKRTIKMGDGSVNYDFIAYSEDLNQYFLQADNTGQNYIYIADENFNIIDSITDIPSRNDNYSQDFCVSGDYILGITHDSQTRRDNYIEVYSISEKSYLGKYYIGLEGYEGVIEVESISEVAPGVLVVATGINSPKRLRFYETKVPAAFDILTQVSNGSITESTNQAVEGEDYTVTFQPEKHYELTELLIDGEEVQATQGQTEYTFTSVNRSHTLEAVFGKIPKYEITTSVEHGTITKSKKLYRDREYKVSYIPDKNYELNNIFIDGELIDLEGHENSYTFENIQKAHSIEVEFSEIPSWPILTSVKNGKITESIEKAYRDTVQVISYEGQEDYILYSVTVDGKKVDRKEYDEDYIFSNVQTSHDIEVVYIWKYIPVIIIAGILIFFILVFYIQLQLRRKKSRERWYKRRKEKQMEGENNDE